MNWLSWLKPGAGRRDACQACLACRERLFRLAWSWTGDAQLADDLVQATCEKALQKWQQVEDVARLEQWACRMMRNLLHDHYRRQRPSEPIEQYADQLDDGEDVEAQVMRDDTRRQVHQALQQLPLSLREVLTLVDLEGYTYQQVAEILEIPTGTVMSRLHRARARLRALLLEDGQSGHLRVVNDE